LGGETSAKSLPRGALKKAGLFYFVFVMFSCTTGGPFGMEEMVTTSGPGLTLLYLLVIPFFWCIPVSLVAAELTTAIPVEGGFYRWVRASFGDFWGFLSGWWNWSASWLLGGSYAVLFSDYLAIYFPSLVGWKHYLVSVALIALLAYVNIRGIRMVGAVATFLEIAVLIPLVILCAIAAWHWHHNPFHPFIPPHVPPFQVFGVGLALGLWLYSGYEQCSSVAEEIENPQRSYPRALAIVVPLSMATYFLPALFSLAALGNWQEWNTAYLSKAAQLIGGGWLGFLMTFAAMLCNISLLNATVLTSTRMPSSMAADGYLPPVFAAKHRQFGTPWIAILISSAIYGQRQFRFEMGPPAASATMAMRIGAPTTECGITSNAKSSVPPHTYSTFASRSRGYTPIIPWRRSSALFRTVLSDSGKNAARPPNNIR
jgi:amino acid transporter